MFNLSLPKEPYWLALAAGVRVRVQPLTTPIYEASRSKAFSLIEKARGESGAVKDLGGVVEGLPDLEDVNGFSGAINFLSMLALAQISIVEWEGVGDADGNPAPLIPDNIRMLMLHHGQAEAFVNQYVKPLVDVVDEGNVSRPVSSGSAGSVPSTAKAVKQKTSPARRAKKASTAATA